MEDAMKRVLNLALAGLFLGVVTAAAQPAQTNALQDQKVRVQVVLDRFEGDTKIGSQPFFFLLVPDEKGTLRVSTDADKTAQSATLACVPAGPVPPGSTQVESTVHPGTDGRYSVTLVFTERALAGCAEVNGRSIPVFSNRIVEHGVTLRNGEPGEMLLWVDSVKKAFTRVAVTVTPAKDGGR
jgi:hypothetical protein